MLWSIQQKCDWRGRHRKHDYLELVLQLFVYQLLGSVVFSEATFGGAGSVRHQEERRGEGGKREAGRKWTFLINNEKKIN